MESHSCYPDRGMKESHLYFEIFLVSVFEVNIELVKTFGTQ